MNENEQLLTEIIVFLDSIYDETFDAKERDKLMLWSAALFNVKNELKRIEVFKSALKGILS